MRLVMGWMGLFIAAGFGVVAVLYWLYPQDLARRKQDGAPSAYDDVTGLPTRRLFLVLLKQALSRAETTKRHVAVLVCTLEQFRPLSTASAVPNVTLVVRVQAARIKSALQPHDVVARLDEHTFAVIADNLDSPDRASAIAKKIQSTVSLPVLIEGQELLMSCRIGGMVGPQQGAIAESLLDAAGDVMESGRANEEGRTLIVAAPQTCLGGHEAYPLPPVSGQHAASLASHR